MFKRSQLLVFPVLFLSAVGMGVQGKKVAEASVDNSSASQTAVTATAGTTSTVVAAPTTEETGILGAVETRPSAYLNQDIGGGKIGNKYGTENTFELGYKFNKNLSLIGDTDINTNLKNSGKSSEVWAEDAYIRMPWNNIWADSDLGLSFSYEPRVFLPIAPEDERNAGYVGAVRNYFKLKKNLVANTLDVTLVEIPVVYAYSKAGLSAKSPNKSLENRIYLITDLSLLDGKLSVSLPILYYYTKYSTIAGLPTAGVKNGNTGHTLYIWPEVSYAVTPNFNAGLAFMTDSFLTKDYEKDAVKLDIGNGFKTGTAQVILRASL